MRGGLRGRARRPGGVADRAVCVLCVLGSGGDCVGGRARGVLKRTRNTPTIVVTRDVSRLSGWLKACVYCRG